MISRLLNMAAEPKRAQAERQAHRATTAFLKLYARPTGAARGARTRRR